MERYYPDVDSESLRAFWVISRAMKGDMGFLQDENCPYDDQTRKKLEEIFEISEKQSLFDGSKDKLDVLEAETEELYSQLKTFRTELKADDVSEHMSYFRTATSLLERLVELGQQTRSIRSVSEFERTVLEAIETIMTPDQRTLLMERLNEAVSR